MRAVVCDPDGKLLVTVHSAGLDGAPLCKGKLLVLEFDTLDTGKEADGLGAALETEVNKLRHSVIRVDEIKL